MSQRLPEDEAGCSAFEGTLALLDDTLSGAERTSAEQHARACAVCGPMVTSWEPVGELLRDHFDSAAERAKPYLADVPDSVFARIDGVRPETERGANWLSGLRPSQRYYAFATAAALAVLVAVPIVRYGGAPAVLAHSCDLDTDIHPETAEVSGQTGFHVHELSFGAENGTVSSAGDELPVIWVNEPDGA